MKRILMLLIILISMAGSPIAGAVVAQEQTDTPQPVAEGNETETPGETPAPTEEPAEEPTEPPTETGTETEEQMETQGANSTEYEIEIGPRSRVVSSSWSEGTVTMVIEADDSLFVTVTDASLDLTKHESIEIKRAQKRIPEGRTRIEFAAEKPGTAAVTVSTSGGMVGLSPGDGGQDWFNRAAGWPDVRVAAVFALFGTVFVGVGVWHTVASRRVDVEAVGIGDDDE